MAATPFETALIHHQAGRLEQAIHDYQQMIKQNPEHLFSWTNLAIALNQLRRPKEAEAACRRALSLNPRHAEAWNNLGIILAGEMDFNGAVAAYRRSVREDATHYLAWTNLGIAWVRIGEVEQAIAALRKAVELRPDHTEALVHLIHQKQQVCDWSNLDPLVTRLVDHMQQDLGEINPFSFLFLCQDPKQMRLCAEHFAQRVMDQVADYPPLRPNPTAFAGDGRLRIGYLSGDFHQHATAILTAELFASHDRNAFQIFAYSYGPDDNSPMRQELKNSFEIFRECFRLTDEAIARQIVADGIHILIDLKGYTRDARPRIVAMRPAPIQVAYLGYPGTMGGRFIDYVIADEVVLPVNSRIHFTENPIYLPGSYQVNDHRRLVAKPGRRAAYGLPETGVVFCCFNQTVKITPEMFSLWLSLLREIPGSVLWLMAFNPHAQSHLHKQADLHGIATERLIFAPPLSHADHLARYQIADIFLDTLPCTAHTTASDALWAGCPVVTCLGETFAGRVAASLLTALGFSEWIAADLAAYRRIALDLAQDKEKRLAERLRLQAKAATSPLFSGKAFAHNLEVALLAIWQHHQAGHPPTGLRVEADGQTHFLDHTTARRRKHLIFTMTPGRSGTAFLSDLLTANLPPFAEVHHEIIGFDAFGVETPDLSHLTQFNSLGNVPHVREFWKQKFKRILAKPAPIYAETSHILMKAGLVENLDLLAGEADVSLILLRRPMLEVVASSHSRGDFLDRSNLWMWYLDPNYPKNKINAIPFRQLGVNGIRLWYLYEIETRSVYYRLLLANRAGVKVVETHLHDLNQPELARQFFAELAQPVELVHPIIPPPSNVGKEQKPLENLADLKRFIHETPFDPVMIARKAISERDIL
ncbi:MAG: tetratricopeptide repeat protein [Magnetococcales bacterium]|nr:tetratricopeptide repeat protein [Magnetococcales bacterium]